MMRQAIFTLTLCLMASFAYASQTLQLEDCSDYCLLGGYLDILEDKEGNLTLNEILSSGKSAQFKPSKSDAPNLGPTHSTYWLRFEIRNNTDRIQNRWLVLHPFMVDVKLHVVTPENGFDVYHTGSILSLAQREVDNVRPIITLKIKPLQSQTYYLRVKTPLARFRMELWSIETFAQKESQYQYVYGIWLGVMVMTFFFNLFIFFSVKDLSYLYYILYLGGVTLSQMGISGHSHYLFPPWLAIKSMVVFGFFYGFWGLQFFKSFLHTKNYAPRLNKLINVLMGSFFIPLVLSLIGMDAEGSIALNLLGLITVIAGIGIGLFIFLKGYKPARFFLLAWAILLCGFLITILGAFRILPWNFFTEYAIRIGSALEVILLSFALADRINLMKAERERALKLQLSESRKYEALSHTFSKFVPHEFIDCLDKKSVVDLRLGDNSQREMSVLFSDIRSFTTLSEKMTPEETFKFINSYLMRMEPAIRNHHGFIDKYIGDSIMALFDKCADDAVQAAIAMLKTIPEYNRHRRLSGYIPIEIGIGINTGTLMLGTVGGEKRMESTVISDAVNLASRIESMTKVYGPLLISEHTLYNLKDPARYLMRIIDRVAVKGKSEAVTIFEIFDGDPPHIRDLKLKTKNRFEEAVFLNRQRKFRQVKQIMSEILNLNPEDNAAQTYIRQCENNSENLL